MTTPDTRARILQAAMALMGREGITGVTASRLAKAVGVSKATVFHHFAAMDDVPNAAFELLVEEMSAAREPNTASLAEALALVGQMTKTMLIERRDFLRAYFSFAVASMYDPAMQPRMAATFIRAKRPIAEILAAHLGADQGDALATRLVALLDGAVLHSLVTGETSPVLRDWEAIAGRLAGEYR